PPSTRDLLASVLGELPQAQLPPPVQPPPQPTCTVVRGPWRVSAKVSSGQVQISNNLESRVVPKEQVEVYLRGHGPAAAPAR
ncbi:MAG: hypothetical protein ACRC1L_13295, partial [Prochlorococcaceae cyanobacterium]